MSIFCATLLSVGMASFATYGQQKTSSVEMPVTFAASVKHLCDRRRTNHAIALQAQDLFEAELATEKLDEFHNFLGKQFQSLKTTDIFGNAEIMDVEYRDLVKICPKFISGDYLRIVFRYNNEWSIITGASAELGNHSG